MTAKWHSLRGQFKNILRLPNDGQSLNSTQQRDNQRLQHHLDSVVLRAGFIAASQLFTSDIAEPTLTPIDYVDIGKSIEVTLGGETILTGVIDDINEPIGKGQHSISLSGRDLAGQLLDCSAPVFEGREMSLSQILRQFLTPYQIKHDIEAPTTAIRQKVTVDVGETVWDAISKAAAANGLWQWFTPEGVLKVGEPNPKTAIVAHLILRRDGVGNNLESLTRQRSLNDRYSSITVMSQSGQVQPTFYQDVAETPANESENGQPNIKATLTDSGLGIHRPKIVMSGDCENVDAARAKAKKMMIDGQLNGHNLTAVVKGHYSETGVRWQPRQRVTLLSEPHGIDGVFFIMGRKFKLGRTSGKTTELRLKQDGIWQVDPFKAKAKKTKSKQPKFYQPITAPTLLQKPS